MKFLKLTRKQKILCNCLLIAVCSFLLAWMLEFPCLTKGGLLKRAERQYLLNGPTELILDREDYFARKILYARNKEGILAVTYDTTPLGFRLGQSQFFPDSDYLLVQDLDVAIYPGYGSQGYVSHAFYAEVIGLPKSVVKAELDIMKEGKLLLCFEGERQEPDRVVFPLYGNDIEGKGVEEKGGLWLDELECDEIVLRLYDSAGNLLQEHSYDQLSYGGNGGGKLP